VGVGGCGWVWVWLWVWVIWVGFSGVLPNPDFPRFSPSGENLKKKSGVKTKGTCP
jgi:hypothetical protein